MNKSDIENVCLLTAHLAQRPLNNGNKADNAQPWQAKRDALKLATLGRRAHKLAEKYCNGYIVSDKYDTLTATLETTANEILAPYDLAAHVTGDPRGYCLKIRGLPGNTWGGDEVGFGI